MLELKLEDYIHNELDSVDSNIAMEFVGFLREKNLELYKDNEFWRDKIYYLVKYNDECVCFIAINDPEEKNNRWTVWSADIDSKWLGAKQLDEELKKIAFKHVDTCGDCGSCSGGKSKNIFGKEFSRVCGCTFRIDNPNKEDLKFMKRMIEIRLEEIWKREN